MRKNIFFNALVSIFIIGGIVNISSVECIKNPQKRPLRVSPYVTEVYSNFQ